MTWGTPTNIRTGLNTSGPTLAFSGVTIPAGGLVVFSVIEHTTLTTGFVSDGTNTYSVAGQVFDGGWFTLSVYYLYYPAGFSGVITYNKVGTSGCYAEAFYITGAATSSQLDSGVTVVSNGYNTSNIALTSGAPAAAGDFFVASISTDNGQSHTAYSNTGSWAPPPNEIGDVNADLFGGSLIDAVGVAQTFNPNHALSTGGWAAIIVAFKQASGGPGGLTAISLTTGSPSLSNPTLAIVGGPIALIATSLVTGSPVISAPTSGPITTPQSPQAVLLAEIAADLPNGITITPAILRTVLGDIVTAVFKRLGGEGTVFTFEDFGAVGDGSTDDTVAVRNAINACPDGGTILSWPMKAYLLSSTVNIIARTHIRIIGLPYGDCNSPGAVGSDSPKFLWNGVANGTMFYFQSCFNPTVKGFDFNSLIAIDRFIRSDLTGVINVAPNGPNPTGLATTGTATVVENCSFVNPTNNINFVGVDISLTSTNNQENCIVRRSHFQGHGGASKVTNDGVSNGTKTITSASFNSGMAGSRVRLSWAQPGTNNTGFYDDVIATASSGAIVLTTNTVPAQTGITVHTGQGYGIGIKSGISQNAKHQIFDDNEGDGLQFGIVVGGGSFSALRWEGEGNDFDICYGYALTNPNNMPGANTATGFMTEPCQIQLLSEAAVIGVYGGGCETLISNSRIENTNQSGQGFFQLQNAVFLNCGATTVAPTATQVLVGKIGGYGGAGNILDLGNNWAITPSQVGLTSYNYAGSKAQWISLAIGFNDGFMALSTGTNPTGFGNLPSLPVLGMEQWIGDGPSSPTWGQVVSADGGGTKMKLIYNGTNWTVAAK